MQAASCPAFPRIREPYRFTAGLCQGVNEGSELNVALGYV